MTDRYLEASLWAILALGFLAGTAGLFGHLTGREGFFRIHASLFNSTKLIGVAGCVVSVAITGNVVLGLLLAVGAYLVIAGRSW